jgi:hypothetical protein
MRDTPMGWSMGDARPSIGDVCLGDAFNESIQIVFIIWESQMASLLVYKIYGNFDFREWFCGSDRLATADPWKYTDA